MDKRVWEEYHETMLKRKGALEAPHLALVFYISREKEARAREWRWKQRRREWRVIKNLLPRPSWSILMHLCCCLGPKQPAAPAITMTKLTIRQSDLHMDRKYAQGATEPIQLQSWILTETSRRIKAASMAGFMHQSKHPSTIRRRKWQLTAFCVPVKNVSHQPEHVAYAPYHAAYSRAGGTFFLITRPAGFLVEPDAAWKKTGFLILFY